MSVQLELWQQKYVVINVNNDPFNAALQLWWSGLRVCTILGKTSAVMGWCREDDIHRIVKLDCVSGWEIDELETERGV